jgi:hypothetical protein
VDASTAPHEFIPLVAGLARLTSVDSRLRGAGLIGTLMEVCIISLARMGVNRTPAMNYRRPIPLFGTSITRDMYSVDLASHRSLEVYQGVG